MKLKLSFKIWILIIVLALSLISIFGLPPSFLEKGVLIKSVEANSSAFNQGLRQEQIIKKIDGQTVNDVGDFLKIIKDKFKDNKSVKTIIETKDSEIILFSKNAPDIIVSDIPKTSIKLGLDLTGGARALIKAENKTLSQEEINDLVEITSNRLNEFGLTDLKVLPVSDLSGNNYMLIEIAGATPDDLKELISKQGKFEAKIGNETVFIGGARDILSVCRGDPTCAGIESCQQSSDGSYFCNFRFSIYLSEEAAKRHANITKDLKVNVTDKGEYLSKKLDLILDDKLVDSLLISKGLKGVETTQIAVSGSGKGELRSDAYNDAEKSMHKLQTILITGSLPYKLEIVKLDTISPFLGSEFIKSILIAGVIAIIAVFIIVLIRYRKVKLSLALVFTSFTEVVIILGVASLIDWNIDLPGIAGILATIGTGLDDLIIILDESTHNLIISLKQRLKNAFAIILGAYFTSLVSLIPLMWAGAGLLKGFAITTIIGISAGVFITRPAFSDIVKKIEK